VTLTHGSAASGIGGGELAAELAGGYEHAWAVELAEHPAAILTERFPGLRVERDLTDRATMARLPAVDVLTAGPPCQPFSVAGKRAGADDDRNLWPDTARLICDVRPRVALLENVPGLRNPHEREPAYLGTVLGDLATLGYDAWWDCVPASAVGAHHRRDRLWIVAFRADVEPFDPFVRFRGDGAAAVGPLWATPTVHQPGGSAERFVERKREARARGASLGESVTDLRMQVEQALWPTPIQGDATGGRSSKGRRRPDEAGLRNSVSAAVASAPGVLNREWVELLQGYPRGWTDRDVAGELPASPPPWHGEGVLRVGDVEGTNPRYAGHWYGLAEVTPLRVRDKQTTPRLMALGNSWVPEVAAPILATIAEHLG
jgi:DNA-cytosine methyltransferase